MARGFILILIFLLSALAHSQPLSEHEVERFITTMKQLQASESYMEPFLEAVATNAQEPDQPGSIMVSDTVELIKGQPAHETLEEVAQDHGFPDAHAWGRVGDQILLAVMSLEMGSFATTLPSELERLENQLQENDHFSDPQKAKMREMLHSTAQTLERIRKVKEADQQAVQPYLEELKRVLAYSL